MDEKLNREEQTSGTRTEHDLMQSEVHFSEDVTAQRRVQMELEHRESQLRTLFDSSYAGIILVDTSGRITVANRRMAEMFNCTLQDLIGSPYPEHVHPDERGKGDEKMRQLILGEIEFVGTERHYIRKDGSDFWGFLSGRRHENEQGDLISLVGHITDITELKQAQQRLTERERYLQAIIDLSPECIKLLAPDGSLIMMNSSGLKMIEADSLEQVHGEYIYPLVVERDRNAFIELTDRVFKGESGILEFEAVGLQGTPIWLETHAVPYRDEAGEIIALLGITRDVTERKQREDERRYLEQQLLHAQKLESLGVLAGGIAHDFNNILTTIIGNADLAMMRLNLESPARENLQRIEQAASRAADLAKQMLAYSGKGRFVVEPIDLNRLVEEMGHMLEVSISKKALLRFNLNRPLPAVDADATQLRQIIMNLVINASEAIGDKSGLISISTGCIDCSEAYLKDAWITDHIHEGLYAFLEVSDTGCGMDHETQSRIFDPFFTTKFTGRGLGMAAVLGIIRGHKGAIKVYSEPDKGSSFKVLIPAGSHPAEEFNCAPCVNGWKGSGVALLVDDEETVRAIGAEMLHELGFETVTASDGRKALEIFTSRGDIAVVILDLTMPHMDGEQCFRELRMIDSSVRVIMSSGYNEQEVIQKFAGKGLSGFVQKPYKLSTLKEALQKIFP